MAVIRDVRLPRLGRPPSRRLDLLATLQQKPGQVLSARQLAMRLYGGTDPYAMQSIRMLVSRIRKMQPELGLEYVVAERGYRIRAEEV